MKRKLFLLSLMLMSVLGISAQKSWIFSDEAFLGEAESVEFTEETTIDGLTIAPAPEGTDAGKGVVIDGNSKTVDGIKYTHRLKLGGSATATNRNLSFAVDGPCNISIVLTSGSSSNDRTLNICKDAYDKNNPIGTMPALGASAEKVTFKYTGEAATIFLGSLSSGINLYAIYVEPLPVYSIVGDFSGGWENDIDMVVSPEDENVYTLTIEEFEAEAKTYDYKLRTNHAWGGYELPASGNNNFEFGTAMYPAGTYKLEFTANVSTHDLTLKAIRPIEIVVTDDIEQDGVYYTTFSSPIALDFTGVEGIKAYVGKKSADSYGEIEGLALSPVEKVPANTGLLIKAEAPGSYIVPSIDQADAVDNDLVVADTDIDLYNAVEENWGSFASGPTVLQKGTVFDWTIYDYVEAVGFLPATKPAAEGTDFLPAGSVYLPISSEEAGFMFSYVKLIFTDVEMPVVENIAALREIASGTDVILNLDATVTALSNSGKVVVQDATGGILVQDGNMYVMENDHLTGTYTTTYNSVLYPQLMSNAMTSSTDYQIAEGTAIEPEVLGLEEAFVPEKVWTLVKMTGLTLSIREETSSYGYTSTAYYLSNAEGTEVEVNDFVGISTLSLSGLSDGDIVDVVGFPVIMSEDNPYFENLYWFSPVSISKQHTYAIVGDLTGGWEADAVMTQSEDDDNVYTLTVEGFEAFAKTYEYKLRADAQWGVYELPAEGNNSYTFEEMGIYTLTFTANIAENSLTVVAEKTGDLVPTYSIVGDFFTDGDISGWDNDQDMTQSDVDENIFTLVVEDFAAAAQTYQYKLRANHQWGLFEIPASGNQEFIFGTEEYPEGTYTLTFTFNAADNNLTLDVESNAPATGIRSMNVDWADGNTYNLNGQRIDTPQKGIVIRNGKKVVVK